MIPLYNVRMSIKPFHLCSFICFLTTTFDFVIEKTESMSIYEWLAQSHMASEFLNQDSTPVILTPHPEFFSTWYSTSI